MTTLVKGCMGRLKDESVTVSLVGYSRIVT